MFQSLESKEGLPELPAGMCPVHAPQTVSSRTNHSVIRLAFPAHTGWAYRPGRISPQGRSDRGPARPTLCSSVTGRDSEMKRVPPQAWYAARDPRVDMGAQGTGRAAGGPHTGAGTGYLRACSPPPLSSAPQHLPAPGHRVLAVQGWSSRFQVPHLQPIEHYVNGAGLGLDFGVLQEVRRSGSSGQV